MLPMRAGTTAQPSNRCLPLADGEFKGPRRSSLSILFRSPPKPFIPPYDALLPEPPTPPLHVCPLRPLPPLRSCRSLLRLVPLDRPTRHVRFLQSLGGISSR